MSNAVNKEVMAKGRVDHGEIIECLMSDGSNRTRCEAISLMTKYLDLSLRRGSETPKEVANDITWFAIDD